jgi:hypothetical protein
MEIITMIISTVGGAWIKLHAQSQADKAKQHEMAIQRDKYIRESVNDARAYNSANVSWTRRFIVVMFMSMMAYMLLAPLLGMPTNVPIEVTEGFRFLFFDFSNTVTKYVQLEGTVMPEYFAHVIVAIIGFYFGVGAAKR